MRYRKIPPSLWNDPQFSRFSDDAKLLYLFISTHPNMTMCGAFRATLSGLAEELKWDSKRMANVWQTFGVTFQERWLNVDKEASLIICYHYVLHNSPDNPNIAKKIRKAFDELPMVALTYQYFQHVKKIIESLGQTFGVTFQEGLANVWGNVPETFGVTFQERSENPPPPYSLSPSSSPSFPPLNNPPLIHPHPHPLISPSPTQKTNKKVKIENEAIEILGYLCSVGNRIAAEKKLTCTNYSACKTNLKHIKLRLVEGITKERLMQIINIKAMEWSDEKNKDAMWKHFGPESLFNSRTFPKYNAKFRTQEQLTQIETEAAA